MKDERDKAKQLIKLISALFGLKASQNSLGPVLAS